MTTKEDQFLGCLSVLLAIWTIFAAGYVFGYNSGKRDGIAQEQKKAIASKAGYWEWCADGSFLRFNYGTPPDHKDTKKKEDQP
jgi:hypothetical protein